MIEEYLSGREFSVAVVLKPNSHQMVAMPVEILAPSDKNGNRILSEAVKDADSEKVLAIGDAVLAERLGDLAKAVFKSLGSRDYARIDIRLDSKGAPNFIEANLMPGLAKNGYLSKCFKLNRDIDYNDMILLIAELGFRRDQIEPITMP